MAIIAPRKTSDFSGFITPNQAGPIFDEARKTSVLMRLVPQMPLGASGESITTTTAKPTAYWTAEGAKKGATQGAKSLVTMAPKKLAAICVNSAEVVRANPGGYVTGLYGDLAEAFALAFDYAGFHGVGGDGTGSGPFDHCLADTTKSIELGTGATIYNDIVAGLSLLVNDGKKLTGFAFDDVAEPLLLDEVDSANRPLLTPSPAEGVYANLIRRPYYQSEGIRLGDTVGFGGNWSKARWGVVGGIQYRVSTEGTVTIGGELVSLFENNLVAILAEAEYGFVMEDAENFVAFTEASLS